MDSRYFKTWNVLQPNYLNTFEKPLFSNHRTKAFANKTVSESFSCQCFAGNLISFSTTSKSACRNLLFGKLINGFDWFHPIRIQFCFDIFCFRIQRWKLATPKCGIVERFKQKNSPSFHSGKFYCFSFNTVYYFTSSTLLQSKKGKTTDKSDFSLKVTAKGFEPPTLRAEIWYSIQLNYAAIFINDV